MSPARGTVVAIDTRATTLAEAEHIVLGLCHNVLLPDDAIVCTHMVTADYPHYALSVTLDVESTDRLVDEVIDEVADCQSVVTDVDTGVGPPYAAGLVLAADEAGHRTGGRAVRFPGWSCLHDDVSVADALGCTAISRIDVLGGPPASLAEMTLRTRGFVRPLWRGGDLVLPVLPAGVGAVAPFEVPNPTPCCGEHA